MIWKKHLFLIEGKIERLREGIGVLVMYLPLVPRTPELAQYKDYQIHMQLVTPAAAGVYVISAQYYGVEIVQFKPAWIADYWQFRNDRYTAEHRHARQERKTVLENLGYTELA